MHLVIQINWYCRTDKAVVSTTSRVAAMVIKVTPKIPTSSAVIRVLATVILAVIRLEIGIVSGSCLAQIHHQLLRTIVAKDEISTTAG
jgi:hypothetical protein